MRPFLSTVALALAAAPALAQSVADQVVAGLQAQGFERIEVTTGPTQLRAEAVRGDLGIEYVYDLRTGALLRQDTSRVDDDDRAPGVEFDRADRDFVGAGDDLDDDDDRDDDDRNDDDRDGDDMDDDRDDDRGDDDDDDRGGDDDRDEGDDDDRDDDDEGDDDDGGDDD
jgi:hypothetical protein